MDKKVKWIIGALVIALLAVGVYGTTTVFADDSNPPHPFGQYPTDGSGGPRGGHALDGPALEAVAGVLNMSTDDLSAALAAGETLPQLAEAAGVDMQQVFEAMGSVRAESMRTRIAQGLEEGSLTQEHADWLLEGLDKGYLDGPGFGFGGRFEKGAPPTTAE